MNEFKDQIDATEKEKVEKLIAELRGLAVKGLADRIREKINQTQRALLGQFQKVYEKRNAESAASSESSSSENKEEKRD